jgi:hypothetical protein
MAADRIGDSLPLQLAVNVEPLVRRRLLTSLLEDLHGELTVAGVSHLADDPNGEPSQLRIGQPLGHGVHSEGTMSSDRISEIDPVIWRCRPSPADEVVQRIVHARRQRSSVSKLRAWSQSPQIQALPS